MSLGSVLCPDTPPIVSAFSWSLCDGGGKQKSGEKHETLILSTFAPSSSSLHHTTSFLHMLKLLPAHCTALHPPLNNTVWSQDLNPRSGAIISAKRGSFLFRFLSTTVNSSPDYLTRSDPPTNQPETRDRATAKQCTLLVDQNLLGTTCP